MHIKSLCVKVHKKTGEITRQKLIQHKVFNSNLKIASEGDYLLIPIIKRIQGYEIEEHEFEILRKKRTPEEILGYTPAYELIGDIAIINRHEADAHRIAYALIGQKRIKTVLQAETCVDGEYRIRKLSFLAGEKKTKTIYKENKCRYLLDLEKVYFTSRLAAERIRIVCQIKDGDKVVDMFAGVGQFSILIAKRYPHAKVIAVDKNPHAIKYLRENIKLNKVDIEIKEGDARDVIKEISEVDHIIMNLPHRVFDFLSDALHAIKKGGIIHLYAIAHEDEFGAVLKRIKEIASRSNMNIIPLNKRIVRPYAPYQYNICIDFRVI